LGDASAGRPTWINAEPKTASRSVARSDDPPPTAIASRMIEIASSALPAFALHHASVKSKSSYPFCLKAIERNRFWQVHSRLVHRRSLSALA
jgi:hypothetical protein